MDASIGCAGTARIACEVSDAIISPATRAHRVGGASRSRRSSRKSRAFGPERMSKQVVHRSLGPLTDDESRMVPVMDPLLPIFAAHEMSRKSISGGEGMCRCRKGLCKGPVLSDLPATVLAVAPEREPNARSWSRQQYQRGNAPRPSHPRQRPRRIVPRETRRTPSVVRVGDSANSRHGAAPSPG